jgi:hypothetical protein
VGLLGGIDQEKEERECARDNGTVLDAQRIDFTKQIVKRGSVGLAVTPGARCRAKALDDLERFLSFQALNDAPERAGQPADILVEGKVLSSRGHRHSI